MVEAGLAGLQQFFSRAFLLGVFFPLLLFAGASAWLAIVTFGNLNSTIRALERQPSATQVLLFVIALLLLAAVAYIVSSFQLPLTRLYEGYWPRIKGVNWVRRRLVERHRRMWRRLHDEQREAGEQHQFAEQNAMQEVMAQRYPPKTRLDLLMPTRLGNILRAAEVYPHERYKIDAAVIWPRLRPMLPDTMINDLTEGTTLLDAMLMLRTLAMVFGTLWPILLAVTTESWELAALAFVGWPIAMIAHRSALAAATQRGEGIEAAFDLYRGELLQHLGFPASLDLEGERIIWDDLTQFYLRNLPYAAPVAPGKGPSDSAGQNDA